MEEQYRESLNCLEQTVENELDDAAAEGSKEVRNMLLETEGRRILAM